MLEALDGLDDLIEYFVELLVYVLHSIIVDDEMAGGSSFFLRPLCLYPLLCLLWADMVALAYPLSSNAEWSRDADYVLKIDQQVEPALKENGTFEPLQSGVQEIVGHGRVNHGIELLFVDFALEQIFGHYALLQLSAVVGVRPDQIRELGLQLFVFAHQSLSGRVAVVNRNTPFPQQVGHIRFARANATSERDEWFQNANVMIEGFRLIAAQ